MVRPCRVTWRVVYRSSDTERVHVFAERLTQNEAEIKARNLRAWMSQSIFGAWAEADWQQAA